MGDKKVMAILVTEEQRGLIESMWTHYNWNLEEVQHNASDNSEETRQDEDVQGNPSDNDDINWHEHFVIEHKEDYPECPECLCRPCITDNVWEQGWWEKENHPPHKDNSFYRKSHYKRFWVMLLHRKVWEDPRYIEKKQTVLELNQRENHAWAGPSSKHARDIMPDCVLQLVRGWLPNEPNRNYMGHKWS
jgi:hypothetical protein